MTDSDETDKLFKGGRSPRQYADKATAEKVSNALRLGPMARVLAPSDAKPPILHREVRAAVHEWMTEIGAAEELKAVGIEPRRTCILHGPPGTGKTTLAHHFAARLKLPLVCIYSDTIQSKYVGETGNNLADVFNRIAALDVPVVLFFDEFDTLAGRRTGGDTGAEKGYNGVVTSLLQRIEQHNGIMIAATNTDETIDPAIWRRFGLHLCVELPGEEERFAICRQYLLPFDLPDEALDIFTVVTEGASPALLKQLMEGIKRSLILNERLKRPADLQYVISSVLASVHPHKDYKNIPLWTAKDPVTMLGDLAWPPHRIEGN